MLVGALPLVLAAFPCNPRRSPSNEFIPRKTTVFDKQRAHKNKNGLTRKHSNSSSVSSMDGETAVRDVLRHRSDNSDEVVLHDDGRGHAVMAAAGKRLESVPSVDISAPDASSPAMSTSTVSTSATTSPASSAEACSPPSAVSFPGPRAGYAASESSTGRLGTGGADAEGQEEGRNRRASSSENANGTKPRRTSTLDPYNLRQRKSLKIRDAELMQSLSFNAVEVVVEFAGMTRVELFSDAYDVAALYCAEGAGGAGDGKSVRWRLVETSERMRCGSQMRCVKKFRMRAATEVDRDETYAIALFAAGRTAELQRLTPHDALAFERVSVSELLRAPNMMLEKRLRTGRRESGAKGSVCLALDIVYHMERDRRISLSIGFDDAAERRNRMFFEVSRALRRGKWAPLYKSEVRTRDEVQWFDAVSFSSQEFHGGDEKKLFRIELFRWYRNGRTRALGFAQASFDKLLSLRVNDSLYWWPVEDGIASTKLVLQVASVTDTECSFTFVMAPLQPR